MIISRLELVNFRSYEKKGFEFANKTVIVGDNGTGKTNILEAIYMLASGKSFRADAESELIRYGENFFTMIGHIGQIGQISLIMSEGRKKFEVNGVGRRMMDFAGNLKAVKFGPEDIEIITGSPSGRRRYLDMVISQKDREYRRSLVSYEKGLRQRNKLLDLIRDGVANRSQLWFWDRLLIKDGGYITESREKYLRELDKSNRSDMSYKSYYDKSVISEERIKQYENEEVAAGSTLVGPHRDDFVVNMDGKDVSKYGSRGQQRMAVLWLKNGEIKYLSDEELPVLLLDDVFSELDHLHRDEVLKLADEYVKNGGQVIMTTADKHLVPENWNIIRL